MSSNYKCSVASCKNNRYNTKKLEANIFFHKFPHSLETKQKWVEFCQKENPWTPSPNNVVCSQHFLPSDYQLHRTQGTKRGTNLLNPQAIPSVRFPNIFLPCNNADDTIETDEGETDYQQPQATSSIILQKGTCGGEIGSQLPEAVSSIMLQKGNEKDILCSKCEVFQRKIFDLKQEIKEINEKNKQLINVNSKLSEKLKELYEKEKNYIKKMEDNEKAIEKAKQEWPREKLIEAMKKNLKGTLSCNQIDILFEIKKTVRWSKQELSAAFTLKYFSQRAYRYLRTDLKYPLPSIRTLQRYASRINLKQGILEDMLTFIYLYAQTLKPMDRECVLSFDEMKVSRVLEYDPSADEVVGPFDYLQVVMMRGLFKQWKQPIFIAFDKKMTKDIILEIISRLSDKGINVVAIVSDNCQANIKCWKDLGARDDIDKPYFLHPKTNKNVYVIPDAPHLLKLTRNWLLDHGFEYNGKLIETSSLLRMVAQRMESEMTPLFKLTKTHIDMTPQQRQNVRRAAELLSRTTAVALRTYFPDDENAKTLADFIEKVYLWFSVSNSYTTRAKLGYKKPYTASEDQICALNDMFETMSSMNIPGKNALQVFQRSIMMQTKSLQMVFTDMKEKHDIDYICTHKLNQDVLENFFSQIRLMGGAYDHPSPLSCIYRIRTIILGKTPTILQNQTTTVEAMNSMQDEYVTVENSLPDARNSELFISASLFDQAEIDPYLPDEKIMEEANNFLPKDGSSLSTVSDTSIELPEQETDGLSYILGYLAKKHHSQYSNINLGEQTFKKTTEHSYSQPPTFVQHLSCGGLFEPSEDFFNLGKKMEKIFLKMMPDGRILTGERIVERLTNKIAKHIPEIPIEIIRSFAKQRIIVRMRYLNLKSAFDQLDKNKRKFAEHNTKAAKKMKKITT